MATGVLSRDPQHPLARYVLLRLALTGRRWAEAEEHVRTLVAAGRDGYDLRLMWARAAGARNDSVEVRRQLEAAARIDENRAPAWQGLYELSSRTDDSELGMRALTRLVDIDQHNAALGLELLRHLKRREDWEALAARGEAMTYVDPLSADPHALLAEAYLNLRQPEKALFEYDSALAVDPNSASSHLGRVGALRDLGRLSEAREAARNAVRLDASLEEATREILQRATP